MGKFLCRCERECECENHLNGTQTAIFATAHFYPRRLHLAGVPDAAVGISDFAYTHTDTLGLVPSILVFVFQFLCNSKNDMSESEKYPDYYIELHLHLHLHLALVSASTFVFFCLCKCMYM